MLVTNQITTCNNTPAFAGGVFSRATDKASQLLGVFVSCMLLLIFLSTYAFAETAPNTQITNQVNVSYQFLDDAFEKSAQVTFITARDESQQGTPSVITLLHRSVDFTNAIRAAQTATNSQIGNNLESSNDENETESPRTTSASFTNSSSNLKQFNSRSAKTSSDESNELTGIFPVQIGACATSASKDNFIAQPSAKDFAGQTVAIPSSIDLRSNDYFKVGDTIFVHLKDLDQNLDPTQAEDIIVSLSSENGLDQEAIRLHETGASTGEFTGYIQSTPLDAATVAQYDCALSVKHDSEMRAQYTDRFDSVDVSASAALFDPSSIVFNSNTGSPVNGIEVTLIDNATGLAATVLGDDGISIFPNPIVIGQTVSDSGGTEYAFQTGGFRFPIIGIGDYRLQIGNSPYYDFPSERSDQVLNTLPNAPFLLSEASRGDVFNVTGSSFQIDIPLDPRDNQVLLTKTANKSQVGVGDVLQYSISLQNTEVPGDLVEIHDKLPKGFRYEKGSTTIDGLKASDPEISSDGRSLVFRVNQISPEQLLKIKYVARVGVSTQTGTATNTAWLVDDILTGNQTEASVEVKEELFSSTTRIFGRVYIGSCDGKASAEGIPDVRIYLENGTYVVTDENGMWHIEGQTPGTHIVQLDTDSLPKYLDLVRCDNAGFHAGQEYSQFVDVQPGGFWRSDFVVQLKPPALGQVTQRLSSQIIPLINQETNLPNDSEAIGSPVSQKIRYQLEMSGTEVILKNLRALIMLPEGVRYKTNSALFDGTTISEPQFYDEQTLLFTLNDPGKNWQHHLTFEAVITPQAKSGELTARAVTMFDSPSKKNQRTPAATTTALLHLVPDALSVHSPGRAPCFDSFSPEMSAKDQDELDLMVSRLQGIKNLQLEISGHTDNVPISGRSKNVFKDNHSLSLARAKNAANYFIEKLNLQPHQVTVVGRGYSQPKKSNNTEEGRAKNRRVEVKVVEGDADLVLSQADSGNQLVDTQGIAPGGFDWPVEATASGIDMPTVQMPEFSQSWFVSQDADFEWVWPTVDYMPNIPSTKVAIKHPMQQRIQLLLNGEPVSELNLAGREKYQPAQMAVTHWSGVDLKEGKNHFTAQLIGLDSSVEKELHFVLHYSGTPTKAVLIPEKTHSIADGVEAPVIAVRLTDKDGYPVRKGLQGDFEISLPYRALDPNKEKAQIGRNEFKPTYEVGDDGIALLTLEPTTQAGEAVIHFPFSNGQSEEIRTWLKPQNRSWMLIALGEGTVGYQNIRGNEANAKSSGHDKEIWSEGRVAFFAKGQIKGEWLVTAAYDSAKGKTTPFEQLIDPKKYYTLYGDSSEQKQDASMEGKLYLRIEKERFYSVFGDFNTDLNKTELSRYVRKFHGIQTVYQGDLISFNLFATESGQRFIRDEIQGDGTSGLYRLSQQDIISNSESIVLQVRDRFRSEIIIQETELNKDVDYVIDYIDGTLFFKSPVHSTDDSFNPVFIVVNYETQTSSEDNLTAGGRIATHLLDDRLELGITAIDEDQGTQNRSMKASDLRIQVNDQLKLNAELAQSEKQTNGNGTTSDAGLISLDYRSDKLQAKTYVRVQEAGFGLDQTNQSESGTEKFGWESTYYFTPQQYISTLLSDQNTIDSEARQQLAELKYMQEYQLGRFHLGARVADTTSTTGDQTETQQLLAGHTLSLMQGDLLLNTEGEFNLKRDQEQYDLLRLGADYRITNKVTLFGAHETSWDRHAPLRSTIGLRSSPWQGAQLNNSVEEYKTQDGTRLFAVHGLNQEVQLTEHWQASFGFDQSQDLENNILETSQNTVAQEDFYAASVGWGYRSQQWQWTNRLEYREADSGHKWNALSGLFHPVGDGLALGLSAEYRLEDVSESLSKFAQLQFDIGLRPLGNGLAWLNQTKSIFEEQDGTTSALISRRIVNNSHINKRWYRTQLSAQYGVKYVVDQIDGQQYEGFIDLIGAEMRHHLTPSWDWGLHGRRLHDYQLDDDQYSTGLSVGFIPKRNAWVSLGYNVHGFVDTDFSNAGYTAQGIYLKIRVKADQDSLRQMHSYFH